MPTGYRSWEERRAIIQAIIADANPAPIASFGLSDSEEVYFRARSARAVRDLAKSSATFKAYYALPTKKPFGYVLGVVALIVSGAVFAGVYLWLHSTDAAKVYPLFATCAAAIVAAIGWAVAGWIGHRNSVRQHTNNMLFSRFSHSPFGEALHRFHAKFGHGLTPLVTKEIVDNLRRSSSEEDQRSAASVAYILNYYELLSSGVINGDLDRSIIEDNVKGLIVYYHDKCMPHVRSLNRSNPRVYQNLIKMRTHYREP